MMDKLRNLKSRWKKWEYKETVEAASFHVRHRNLWHLTAFLFFLAIGLWSLFVGSYAVAAAGFTSVFWIFLRWRDVRAVHDGGFAVEFFSRAMWPSVDPSDVRRKVNKDRSGGD